MEGKVKVQKRNKEPAPIVEMNCARMKNKRLHKKKKKLILSRRCSNLKKKFDNKQQKSEKSSRKKIK